MNIILASVQHQKAASAFRHLDALYRQILQSAETLDPDADEEDGAEILEELQTILGTILVLLDPLCARSLELLLGLEQGTVQPALRPFHSVLSISNPPYPIRVFHKSFPDFLSDQGRSDVNSWYHVDTKKHHTRLALLCLNHMNVMLQRDMCGVGDLEKNEIPDLERLLDEKVKPHLLYACHHWGTHLSQAEHSEALDGALHNLCMTKLLHWLEILSLTGKLNTGVQALTLVKDWCDPNNVVLGTILNDCYRFLLLFRDIFAIGPSHIYQSGLPFMPDCELFNIMQKEANVTVKYGKPQGWSNILFRLQMESESFLRSISISPDCTLVAVGFMGGDISIWSTKYGTLLRTFDVGRIWLNAEALAFSPDGAYLASGNLDGTIAILDAKTGVLRHKANVKDYDDLRGSPFDNSVKRILFAPNGNHFATVSQSLATITIWNATDCNRIHQFHVPNPTVAAIAFSPDSNKLVAFCFEDTGILFDVVTGRVIDEIALSFYHYSAIAFSPDGNHIAVANPCPELTWMAIWDISSRSFVFPDISESVLRRKGIRIGKPDMDFQFSYLMYSVDGTQLSCYSSAGEVRIWDAKTGDLLQSFRNHVFYESPCFVSLSPDASLIASTRGIDRMIVVGAAQTPIQNDPGEIPLLEQVRSLVFSPDGAVIASISSERVIYLWDPHTAVCTTTFKSFDFSRAIPKAVFSPDGTKLAAVSTEWQNGFDVQILDVLDKGVDGIKFGNDEYKAPKCGELDTIAFSPDGNQFVLSSELGGIVIWDTISGNRIRSFPAQTDARVRSLLFSPDGTLLFSGCSNNIIMAWSITTGELCKSLTGHAESVTSLMISPDDRLISRDKSGKIIYWNVDDLEPIGEGQVPEVYSDEDYYDPTSTSQKIELFHRNGQIVRISGGVCRPLCGLVGHEVISSASYGSVFAYGTDSGEFYIVDFSKALAS
ncbi:hypothetical protein FRC02_011547 [Tulasnella sp. 418]|nr:hypothetical protein FRC02_011547 [Tulasnella sp. 418]